MPEIFLPAGIVKLSNPSEAWANLRRSDYPTLQKREKFGNFTYPCVDGFDTPVRLKYPNLEMQYNSVNYKEAIERLGGNDDWHKRMWWDVAEQNFQ